MDQPTDSRPSYGLKEQLKLVNLLGQGKTATETSSALGRSRSGVCYAIKKYEETGSTERRKGSGREIQIDQTVRGKILDYFKNDSRATYKDCIRDLKINCSVSFISKFLKSHGIQAYKPVKKPLLNDEHLDQRKFFSEAYQNWELEQWAKVVFTDEKTFLSCSNGNALVKRIRGTAFQPEHLDFVQRRKFSVNMWGCMIGSDYTFRVYHVDKKFNSPLYRYLLRRVILPKLFRKFDDSSFIFQQDNASIHTTEIIRNLLIEENVEQLFWPPCSPDLSPIENLWGILQKKVNIRLKHVQVANEDELFNIVKEKAKSIPSKAVKKLFKSMPKRIKQMIENNYGPTKY